MNKKKRNKEINSVNIMVVNEQHNDSTFQSQAFLSKTNDEATFILDTGYTFAKILLYSSQDKKNQQR
jgi:hypothetical protein